MPVDISLLHRRVPHRAGPTPSVCTRTVRLSIGAVTGPPVRVYPDSPSPRGHSWRATHGRARVRSTRRLQSDFRPALPRTLSAMESLSRGRHSGLLLSFAAFGPLFSCRLTPLGAASAWLNCGYAALQLATSFHPSRPYHPCRQPASAAHQRAPRSRVIRS